MTDCVNCGCQNPFWRRRCQECGHEIRKKNAATIEAERQRQEPDGFDGMGFAVGMVTGVPLSPTHGFSTGALLGAALHSSPAGSEAVPTPPPNDPEPACSSYSSSDSGSSYDSGSCGGGDSGGGGSSGGGD